MVLLNQHAFNGLSFRSPAADVPRDGFLGNPIFGLIFRRRDRKFRNLFRHNFIERILAFEVGKITERLIKIEWIRRKVEPRGGTEFTAKGLRTDTPNPRANIDRTITLAG